MSDKPVSTPVADLVASFWSWMKDMHVAKVSISCNDGSLSCTSFGPDVIAAIVDERATLKAENERLRLSVSAWEDSARINKARAEAAESALADHTSGEVTEAEQSIDMQLNAEERALANDMRALYRPEEQAVTEAMVDRFMKRMGWSDPIHEPVRPTVRAALEAALRGDAS